jgi:hypothetical protein
MLGEEDRAMDHPPRDAVIERLEALERENRWMWRVGIVTVVAAIIFLVEATSLIRPPKIVEAEGFVLKDASGRVRGQLRTTGGGLPEFTLLDEDGYDQVNLHGTYDNNASLDFFDHGQPRIQLTASSDGSAMLRMSDDGDENRLALFLRRDGTTGQAFENPERGFLIGVQPDGMAGLCVVDGRGNELDRLGSLPDELQCVRTNEVIYGAVRGPFRTRGAPIAEATSALQALDRRANRADESLKAGLPPQGRSSRL